MVELTKLFHNRMLNNARAQEPIVSTIPSALSMSGMSLCVNPVLISFMPRMLCHILVLQLQLLYSFMIVMNYKNYKYILPSIYYKNIPSHQYHKINTTLNFTYQIQNIINELHKKLTFALIGLFVEYKTVRTNTSYIRFTVSIDSTINH